MTPQLFSLSLVLSTFPCIVTYASSSFWTCLIMSSTLSSVRFTSIGGRLRPVHLDEDLDHLATLPSGPSPDFHPIRHVHPYLVCLFLNFLSFLPSLFLLLFLFLPLSSFAPFSFSLTLLFLDLSSLLLLPFSDHSSFNLSCFLLCCLLGWLLLAAVWLLCDALHFGRPTVL